MSLLVPIVEIELDRVRHLRFDLNAMILFEDLTGVSMVSLLDGTSDTSTGALKQIRALIYALVAWEDPDLTPEMIGQHLDFAELPTLMGKIKDGMAKSLPVQKVGAAPLKQRAKKPALPVLLVSTG